MAANEPVDDDWNDLTVRPAFRLGAYPPSHSWGDSLLPQPKPHPKRKDTVTDPGPISQDKLDELVTVANQASYKETVVVAQTLCRIGAILQVNYDYRDQALDLVRAAGYAAELVHCNIVVTVVVDHLALLEAQIARLNDQRNDLLDARRASEFETAMGDPS